MANELHADRLNTLVSITSTSSSDCVYTATADNRSRDVSFADFSKIDVFARYNVAAGDSVAKRLTYPSEWNVSAISSDNTNPNVWDSGETATIALSLTPKPQGGTKGVVVLAVPGGIVESAYFNICSSVVYRYWHNDPTPPTGPTESHLVLTMDATAPSVSTLYNYGTDRDDADGLMIQAGGSGPGEEDEVKHQAWRSSSQAEALVIAGDVTIDFWAAIKDFQPDKRGRVTIYLRDRDDTAGYTEIGDATVNDRDWQGGSGTFVKKTLVISGINYTVPVDHALEAKLIVHEQSEDDMVFAYDTTTHPSVVKLP